MIKKMGYRWNLRKLMADRDMFQTSDMVPLLAERGAGCSWPASPRSTSTTGSPAPPANGATWSATS